MRLSLIGRYQYGAVLNIGFLSKTEINIERLCNALAPRRLTVCRSKKELYAHIEAFDVLIVQNQGFKRGTVDAEILARASQLRMIQHHGVATDITDIQAAAAQGILVATVPSQNSRSVAEHGMHLILALARRASLVRRLVAEGSMGEVECVELDGKTLCIVGLGTIGKMIAVAASGFGMHLVGVSKNISKCPPNLSELKAFTAPDLHEALALADFSILVLPLNDETENIIDQDAFSAMKRGAFLINVSRGGHVDRSACEAALDSGQLAGYAADAMWEEPVDPNDPMLNDERVVLTPHIGGKSAEAIERITNAIRSNILRFELGKPLLNVVNMDAP